MSFAWLRYLFAVVPSAFLTFLTRDTREGISETGVPHSCSMPVPNRLCQYGVLSDLIPINLATIVSTVATHGDDKYQSPLTSFKLFCFNIANSKQAVGFSAWGVMAASFVIWMTCDLLTAREREKKKDEAVGLSVRMSRQKYIASKGLGNAARQLELIY